jgi:phage antirepressor YoqD-like protein
MEGKIMEALVNGKTMTTEEVCRALGCDKVTLLRNWRDIETVSGAETVKKIEQGKTTYWAEPEVTLILEKMKGNSNNQSNLPSRLEGIQTSQSRVLKLHILQKQMQDIYEAEIAELKAKTEADKPKVEFFDQVADSADALQMRDVAGVLNLSGWGRNKIFDYLRKHDILDDRNIPYREYQDRGYFRVVEQKYTDKEGDTHINLKTLVYQRGVDFIRRLIQEAA